MEAWRVECSWWNDRGEKHGAWNARGLSLFWERLRASLHLMLTYAGGLVISECGWLRKKRVKQVKQSKLTKSSALMYRPQRRLTRGMRVEYAWNARGGMIVVKSMALIIYTMKCKSGGWLHDIFSLTCLSLLNALRHYLQVIQTFSVFK
jgi:hypothetical protein